jgi:hypothetical protein|tara:strand:+ start:361 stop:1017 length:657 start_codon:yes stop_codon:yes gene_type:complete
MNNIFLTGCDRNTEWQLPWFLNNYFRNNSTPIRVANFGMSEEMLDHLSSIDVDVYIPYKVDLVGKDLKGWFKKPRTIYEATYPNKLVCWLDTDCEVVSDISSIFDYYVEDKIGMVQDRPWSKRRPDNGPWYNSGVVLTNRNWNLRNWVLACEKKPIEGDQQVLHYSMSEIEKIGVMEPLPHKFNSLRLDYVDGIEVKNPLIIHHTGSRGNDKIRSMMS